MSIVAIVISLYFYWDSNRILQKIEKIERRRQSE